MSVPRIPVPATKMQIAPTLMALTDVIADKDLLEMEKPVKVCNASLGITLWEHFILQPW